MANLIVSCRGNRGSTHRLGSKVVTAHLATWTHGIDVWLDSDGDYKIQIGKLLDSRADRIIEGNVKEIEE